jgi:DNA-directed RNA polymerase subunit H (RpoH/RPB5)
MNEVIRSFITLKEMLADRGVDTSNLDCISDAELDIMYRTNKVFSLQVNENFKIIYYMNSKFKINELKKLINSEDKIIIIFKEKINNLNIKNLKEYEANIELFIIKELLINISKHTLVPKHEVISNPTEISKIMKEFNLKTKSQLPIILRNDPMARYLDIKSGDIVKISRNSPSAGEATVYRYCN